MTSMPPDRCALCGAEETAPVNLAARLEGFESWILLPHCRTCLETGPERDQETARRVIERKRERLAARPGTADGEPKNPLRR